MDENDENQEPMKSEKGRTRKTGSGRVVKNGKTSRNSSSGGVHISPLVDVLDVSVIEKAGRSSSQPQSVFQYPEKSDVETSDSKCSKPKHESSDSTKHFGPEDESEVQPERRPRTSAYVAPQELSLCSIIVRLYDQESEDEVENDTFRLTLYYDELRITNIRNDTSQDVFLKRVGEVSLKNLPEYCSETGIFRDVPVLELYFPFNLDPFLKFSVINDKTEFQTFADKLQNRWKLCSSLYRCPKCKISILAKSERTETLCRDCNCLVLPELKSDMNEVLESVVPSSNTETIKAATDDETSSRYGSSKKLLKKYQ